MSNVRNFLPVIRYQKHWGFYVSCLEFLWETQSSKKCFFLHIKNATFPGTAKFRPHLALRFPQIRIMYVPPSVKFFKKIKIIILSLSQKWSVLSKFSSGVYTAWRCPLQSAPGEPARAFSTFMHTAKCTHIPGKSDDWIKWQGCRRRCINHQPRETQTIVPRNGKAFRRFFCSEGNSNYFPTSSTVWKGTDSPL